MEIKLTQQQLDYLIKVIEQNLEQEIDDMDMLHNLYSKLIILTMETP